ncbi:Glutathione transport system permease protein GsiD [Geodia barretti]|uniref:Glutathione transport system permease protein GsiD n=1 Tax=Geodia barretti TaxID=519541 RepID=A0AA35XA41_GEOBA|nr:Glutathione transport system permease protein GsiD [Geodia barretti]
MRPKRNLWQNLIKFSKDKPLGAFGGSVAVLLIVLAILAPLVATHNPETTNYRAVLATPSVDMLLGGDQLGRDVFSRLIYGTRISLLVGILSVLFGVTIGLAIGLVSGYFGGAVDLAVQRLMDAVMAFPALILALSIMAVMGASIVNVIIALAVVFIPGASRTIRSQALSIKETDYVLAARAIGVSDLRIMVRHMAPNLASTYIVLATISLGWAIVVEASLSFLGVGVPPNVAIGAGQRRRKTEPKTQEEEGKGRMGTGSPGKTEGKNLKDEPT